MPSVSVSTINTLQNYKLEIYFIFTIAPRPTSSQWFVYLRSPQQLLYGSPLSHIFHTPRPPHPSCLDQPNTISCSTHHKSHHYANPPVTCRTVTHISFLRTLLWSSLTLFLKVIKQKKLHTLTNQQAKLFYFVFQTNYFWIKNWKKWLWNEKLQALSVFDLSIFVKYV